jgi:hypothetical protein
MKGRNEKENKRSAATTVRTSDFKVTRQKKTDKRCEKRTVGCGSTPEKQLPSARKKR